MLKKRLILPYFLLVIDKKSITEFDKKFNDISLDFEVNCIFNNYSALNMRGNILFVLQFVYIKEKGFF